VRLELFLILKGRRVTAVPHKDQEREGAPGGTNSVETMLLQSQKRYQQEKNKASHPPPHSFL
jgi:hypothetical protein